jgi:hypothetical protein
MSQPSAQGIASLFRGNPAPLQQRIQQEQQAKPGLPQDLQKLMALNIVTNEKDAMAKQQALSQLAQMQGPQGKPPTVMESVQEQARQKMQAQQVQAQQKQQAMQAMMQQAGPGPVPEGTQFAQAQPTAQGIDELPVEFGLAGGGIIAFQEGKKVPRIQDEVPISDEERTRLEQELLMRIIGEEARNSPPPKRPPMEITESDLSTVPGLESGNLYTRAMREASGPQPDNRAMLNAPEESAARKNAMLDREREKAASRPKYETPYDRMNRQNRGEPTADERQAQAAREARIAQIPMGGDGTVTGGERVDSSEAERRLKNTLVALPGASASRGLSGSAGSARGVLAGIVGLLGLDKNKTSAEATPQGRPASPADESGYSKEGRTGARPYTPEPIADLKAQADADAKKQRVTRPPTPAAQAPAPAAQQQQPVAAPPASITPPISALQAEAQALDVERMRADPQAAAANKELMYQSRIGAPDTTQRDAMIKQLQAERDRQVGPQDSYGQLMEYLGQIAATPRGLSSFGAGAAGVRGVQALEEQRAQKRFDLGSKIIEQEQGKIDASRTYAKELYGVGEKEYDRIFKEKYDAAKAVGTSEMESRKLAQQETLKLLEIQQRATEARERNETQLKTATIGQTGNFNEQARINKITSLKQQARRATDPKVAAELMAQATDLEALVSRGGSGGAAAERNDIAAVKAEQVGLLKELENLGLPKDVRQRKQEQLDATYKRLNDLYGGTGASAPQKGKVVDFNSLPK